MPLTEAQKKKILEEEVQRKEEEEYRTQVRNEIKIEEQFGITGKPTQQQSTKQSIWKKQVKDIQFPKWVRVVSVIAMIIFLIIIYANRSPSTEPSEPNNSATSTKSSGPDDVEIIGMAKEFVQKNLKAPSTANFPWCCDPYKIDRLGNGEYTVSSYVDAENSFGAKIRSQWVVLIKDMGDNNNWKLINISISP